MIIMKSKLSFHDIWVTFKDIFCTTVCCGVFQRVRRVQKVPTLVIGPPSSVMTPKMHRALCVPASTTHNSCQRKVPVSVSNEFTCVCVCVSCGSVVVCVSYRPVCLLDSFCIVMLVRAFNYTLAVAFMWVGVSGNTTVTYVKTTVTYVNTTVTYVNEILWRMWRLLEGL